jgi:hypothetical protein
MNPMSLSSHRLLKLFVLLLLTVFISETVYASGMMASVQFSPSHTETHAEHCYELPSAQQTHKMLHTHAICIDCSHCFACFSIEYTCITKTIDCNSYFC